MDIVEGDGGQLMGAYKKNRPWEFLSVWLQVEGICVHWVFLSESEQDWL